MKKLIIFIVGTILGFLSLAFGAIEPKASDQPSKSDNRCTLMLKDVSAVYVSISHRGPEPNTSISWDNLHILADTKLKQAGIKIAAVAKMGVPKDVPNLRITITTLNLPQRSQMVFYTQTALYQPISPFEIRVEGTSTWQMDSLIIQSADGADANEAITKTVMQQVETFIKDCQAGKVKRISLVEPNDNHNDHLGQVPTIQASPKTKTSDAAKETYIASKNSKVFHLMTCAMAQTISAGNLIKFASREEAVSSGRRPCKKCNP